MTDVVPYQSALTEAIRATNACLTADGIEALLKDHAQRAGFRRFWYDLIDVHPPDLPPGLKSEVDFALDSPEKYFNYKNPWLGDTDPFCPGSYQITRLVSLLTKMYGEASAEAGRSQVKAEALTDLATELVSPSTWWDKLRPWLIALGVLLAALVVLQFWRRA